MAETKKQDGDVSKMTFAERQKHIQDSHRVRQAVTVTPHDLRVAEREKKHA